MTGEGWVGDAFAYVKKAASSVAQRVVDVTKGKRQGYSPKVRAYLAENGNKTIQGLILRRDPIRGILHTVINALTLGNWAAARRKYAYDKVFHLGLEVTLSAGPTTIVEKNEVINVGPSKPIDGDTETMVIGDPGVLTLQEMLDRTQKLMGDRFFNYSAFENNCQDFIIAILRANNLWTAARDEFVKQPLESLVKELPSYTGRVANVATDLAALADVAIQGRGRRGEASAFLKSLRGGLTGGVLMTKAQYDARLARLPADAPRQSYDEYVKAYQGIQAARTVDVKPAETQRCPADRLYDPEKEYNFGDNVCVERPDGTITYVEVADPGDPMEPCMVGHPRGPKRNFGNMKRSECARINEEGLKKWEESRSGTDKFFSGVLKGLTTVADTAVDIVGQVPGIGKAAAEAYKQFAPPGSAFYNPDKGALEKIVDTARGIAGMGKGQKVVMSLADFKKEHRNLIRLLRKYPKPDLRAEAAEQSAELKKYGGCCGSVAENEAFLREARRKAKAAGLNWRSLQLSDKAGKKLMITAPDGRTIHFGAKGMGDFIHYKLAHDPKAEEHRRRYRARATKIRGDWAKDKYSPNSLAIAVLW